jgi:hypothetical protein
MKKIEQDNLRQVRESYQGTDPLERAYQGVKNQAGETPPPPQVGSTASVPAPNEGTSQSTPQDNE